MYKLILVLSLLMVLPLRGEITQPEYYHTDYVEGYTVYVENTLMEDNSEDVNHLKRLMGAHLVLLENMVNDKIHEKLQTIPFALTDNSCGSYAGRWTWIDELQQTVVELCRVDLLVNDNWLNGYVIHELAHGYHDKYITEGFQNQTIINAYHQAVATGKYRDVKRSNGSTREEAHAISTDAEYFAHLSNKYLGTDGEAPFTRSDLEDYDPIGFAIAERVWLTGNIESTDFVDPIWRIGLRAEYVEGYCEPWSYDREWSRPDVYLTVVNSTGQWRYIAGIDASGEVPGKGQTYLRLRAGTSIDIVASSGRHYAVFNSAYECLGRILPGTEDITIELN